MKHSKLIFFYELGHTFYGNDNIRCQYFSHQSTHSPLALTYFYHLHVLTISTYLPLPLTYHYTHKVHTGSVPLNAIVIILSAQVIFSFNNLLRT